MKFLKYFVFLFLFSVLSCAHTQEEPQNRLSFVVDRDTMWKVMVKVFKPYPLKEIDPQTGYLETKEIKGDQVWKAPFQKNEDFYGYSYTIQANLNYKKPVATVSIYKKVYQQKGFISEKKQVPSDYLEEAVLFYHILRELELQKKLDL